MRVPLSWLRDFAPLDHPVDVLVHTLNDLGLAVESVDRVGDGLEGVVVAKVIEIGPIPKADKIRRVVVDAGGDEPVQVVCGAWNFSVGENVPLATVGSVLPGDFAIGARKMKGVESHGMLCAPDELGLPGAHDGILVLPEGLEPGTPFAEAMGITADVVVDLEINPNRPDAMSVAGVARDLAARLGVPFAIPEPKLAEGGVQAQPATVRIEAAELCGRFVGAVIDGISVGPSPAWIANRLALAGMRPINNVVDASNYVMLELGTPNHAYDLSRLPGRGLVVRRADDGEVLVTLDEVERRLTSDDLLICDAERTPVGIAGIMGGASSEISERTTEVLLEVAWFLPIAISRSSRRLKLRTEASARFEKGVDWAVIDTAVRRFCELLGVSPGAPAVDERGELPGKPVVRVRTARVNDILGTELGHAEITGHLDAIGFATVAHGGGDLLDVTIPTWRPDSEVEIDVIEEVARLHGYSRIRKTVPTSTLTGGLTPYQRDRRLVRQLLAGYGTSEAWSTSFLSEAAIARCGLDVGDAVVVANPLVADESLLRPSLLPGLVAAVAYNGARRQPGVQLFEVGKVFRQPPQGAELPREWEAVAVAVAGRDATEAVAAWGVVAEGLLLDGARIEAATAPGLHPTRTARIVVGGETIGLLGEVDPGVLTAHGVEERVAWFEVDLEALLAAPHGSRAYVPISRFPSSDIDLAFEVDEAVPAGDIAGALAAGDDLVVDVRLFDVYRGAQVGEGRRSLAFTVRLQAGDRTLTDEAVTAARRRLIAAVESAHRATLRG
ncbi:MAG: phenylalanine--tRNA ligase subunit beta [Acidimicrobiales bacterium]